MGRRQLLAVEQLPLVGGALCLDLVNTTGARASPSPRERLRSYDDLLVWSRRAGILEATEAARLGSRAAERVAEAERALERIRGVRETLFELFRAVASGTPPPGAALARLAAWWRAERGRRELVATGSGFDLRLRRDGDELDPMRWPVIAAAVELLTSDRLAQLKRCGECDWLFLDESKNRSRTWCKKQCGDRRRARRHYDRVRQQPRPR